MGPHSLKHGCASGRVRRRRGRHTGPVSRHRRRELRGARVESAADGIAERRDLSSGSRRGKKGSQQSTRRFASVKPSATAGARQGPCLGATLPPKRGLGSGIGGKSTRSTRLEGRRCMVLGPLSSSKGRAGYPRAPSGKSRGRAHAHGPLRLDMLPPIPDIRIPIWRTLGEQEGIHTVTQILVLQVVEADPREAKPVAGREAGLQIQHHKAVVCKLITPSRATAQHIRSEGIGEVVTVQARRTQPAITQRLKVGPLPASRVEDTVDVLQARAAGSEGPDLTRGATGRAGIARCDPPIQRLVYNKIPIPRPQARHASSYSCRMQGLEVGAHVAQALCWRAREVGGQEVEVMPTPTEAQGPGAMRSHRSWARRVENLHLAAGGKVFTDKDRDPRGARAGCRPQKQRQARVLP